MHGKVLIDAKSRRTGFADLFKIYGWRIFLDIPSGCIVRHEVIPAQDLNIYEKYCPKLSISVRQFSWENTESLLDIFPAIINCNNDLRRSVFFAGWYAATAERVCYHEFNNFRKVNPDFDLVHKIQKYDRACRVAFFNKNPLERVLKLYRAFQAAPLISGECIQYIAKKENISVKKAQDKVFDKAEYLWVQYAMLLEHRARIQIIKNAVEAIDGYSSINMPGILSVLAPNNFVHGFNYIKRHKHRYRIPYLLHLFIEVFGGYYLKYGSYDQDTKMISAITGIPESDLIECLGTINEFFPTPGGWFISYKDELHTIKFFPAVWRGIGCFVRHKYLFRDRYEEIAPNMGWLLGKYHNVAYNALSPVLEDKDKPIVSEK